MFQRSLAFSIHATNDPLTLPVQTLRSAIGAKEREGRQGYIEVEFE